MHGVSRSIEMFKLIGKDNRDHAELITAMLVMIFVELAR